MRELPSRWFRLHFANGPRRVLPTKRVSDAFSKATINFIASLKSLKDGMSCIVKEHRSPARGLANGQKVKRILLTLARDASLCKKTDERMSQLQHLLEALAIFPKRIVAVFMDTNSSMDAFVSTKLAEFDTNLEEDETY